MDKCVFSAWENTHWPRCLFHSNIVSRTNETSWNHAHCDPSLFNRGWLSGEDTRSFNLVWDLTTISWKKIGRENWWQLQRRETFRHMATPNVHHFTRCLGEIPVYQYWKNHIHCSGCDFSLAEEEPQNLSKFVQKLKDRLNHIHQKMVQKEKSAIDLETGRNHGRQAPDFQEGDVDYMFLATIKLNLSRKLQNRWIGPWKIRRRVSDSLVILFPLGNRCKNKRELACIVSRLKKILILSQLWVWEIKR